ncbi:MAG: GntR family transcriptional regulator [Thermodesulfobacteriota bacterium]
MKLTYSEKTYRSDRVFQTLRDRIVARQYPPGARLSEKELCREFQVSRTPLREAIRKLEEMKLVNVVPRFGTYVSEVSLDEVRWAYEVRLKLEQLAVELAAQRATPEQLDRLDLVIGEAENMGDHPAHGLISELDNRFHDLICQMAHNPVLADLIYNLRLTCSRLWTTEFRNRLPVGEIASLGREIFQALKKRDGEAAARLMFEHVRLSLDRLRKYLL